MVKTLSPCSRTARWITNQIHLVPIIALMSMASLAAAEEKTRIIATTDGEIDDRCSMVRFLLCANEWDIRGIIHSSSTFHWAGDENHKEKGWKPVEWLDEQLDAYTAVYPNLKLHDPDYPSPAYLKSQVFVGNIGYEGDMEKDTPGSNRIVEVLLEEDDSPVWLQAWGGSNTIARALKTIQEKHPDRVEEVKAKVRLFLIARQDKTLDTYILPQWPGIQVLLSDWPSFEAIAYPWKKIMDEEQRSYFDKEWMTQNILEDHGPLCGMYESNKGSFRSEGDTPAYLHVISNGLQSEENPAYGGWGGRFHSKDNIWISVDQRGTPVHSILRWAIYFQNDWAARADWCVKPYDEANHEPKVQLGHEKLLTARKGEIISLDASGTTDPDGNPLHFSWWQFGEAGSYPKPVEIAKATESKAQLTVPKDASPGDTLHLICTVSDGGSPPLSQFARVIIEVKE